MSDLQMTPAETLTAAADELARADRWEIVDRDDWLRHVSEHSPVASSYLRLLMDCPGPLADWLRLTATWAPASPGSEDLERALAVARSILHRA